MTEAPVAEPAGGAQLEEEDRQRLRAILQWQHQCDEWLTRVADPQGKSVLVLGAGAGTDMLWCLRHGAREVVGIDACAQSPAALIEASREFGVDRVPFTFMQLAIEEARSALGRRFDLVLSNNVLEHVADLGAAFRACGQLVEPWTGRVAFFADPLFWSSAGSHLEHRPWGHVAPDRDEPWPEVSDRLNRSRLSDFLDAIAESGLALLHLGVVPDRNLAASGIHLPQLQPRLAGVSFLDLTVEGIYGELVRSEPGPPPPDLDLRPVSDLRRLHRDSESSWLAQQLSDERRGRLELQDALRRVARSPSFRLGKTFTWPLRKVRDAVAWLRRR